MSEESIVPGAAPSRAVRVTFFEDRAEVVRHAEVVLAAGVSRVAVSGLSLTVDDPSLVARVVSDGAARIVGARVRRRAVDVTRLTAKEREQRKEERDRAVQRRAAAEAALARAVNERARLTGLLEQATAALVRVPRGVAMNGAAWREAHAALDEELTRALGDASACHGEVVAARLDERRVELRLAEAESQSPHFEATAELQVDAPAGEAGRTATIELTYRTPLALFRPEHTARLVEGATGTGGATLELRTVATVWQHTGEDWTDVKCRFSTARPASAASPPLLTDDALVQQRRHDRNVVVEARDQAVQTAGLGRGSRTVDDMPGVEDGGEPLAFEAEHPVTIPSNGRPFRVAVDSRTLPCEVDVVLFPELSHAAHVRATATLNGDGPLVAGPVQLARGTSVVGRGRTAFVGRGEAFELGFGPDDALRVHRRVDEKRERAALTGAETRKRTVTLHLSNLSGKPRRVLVLERVPVSELADVSIRVVDRGGADIDADGLARRTVEVPPNGHFEQKLAYEIHAPARVTLPF